MSYDDVNVNYKYLKYFYTTFFKGSNYQNLTKLEKSLFTCKEEYQQVKDDFKQKLIIKKFTCLNFSLVATFAFNFIYNKIIPYITIRQHRAMKIKPIFLFTVFIGSFQAPKLLSINASDIINLNTKFGLYFYFENKYRNEFDPSYHELDERFESLYSHFKESKIKNKDTLNLILFYNDLKEHYLYSEMMKELLLRMNGHVYLNYFNTYRYKDKSKKDLLSGIIKSFNKEYTKLVESRSEKYKEKVEVPVINKENIALYFDLKQIVEVLQADALRDLYFKNIKDIKI